MPNDHMHFIESSPRSYAQRSITAVPTPANSNPSVRDLLSRNGALVLRNTQLTLALARQKAVASTAVAQLTPRQQQIMALVLAGHPSKNIAADLQISQRTVENHRAAIMRRTGAASMPALVRLSLGIS